MTRAQVDAAIEAIVEEDRPALLERWAELFDDPPPKSLRRTMLRRVIVHEIQLRAFGRPSKETQRQLDALVRDQRAGRRKTRASAVGPGARLVREWNGRTHVVEVTEDGAVWNGKTYASLSAVARAITGARWSGPRFFGIARR